MECRVSYDLVADALYIRAKDDEIVDSLEVNDGIIVDFNKYGEVVGVEILNFSKSNVDLDRVVRGPRDISSGTLKIRQRGLSINLIGECLSKPDNVLTSNNVKRQLKSLTTGHS